MANKIVLFFMTCFVTKTKPINNIYGHTYRETEKHLGFKIMLISH